MNQPETNLERRLMLRGVVAGGAVLAAGSALAACGSDPAASNASVEPSTPDAGSGGDGGEVLVSAQKVPEGGGIILDALEVVVTQPTAGQFVAFSSICTHQGCSVAEVTDGTINCPCHGSKFSVEDGSVVAGPAPAPLPAIAVTVDGKSVVRA